MCPTCYPLGKPAGHCERRCRLSRPVFVSSGLQRSPFALALAIAFVIGFQHKGAQAGLLLRRSQPLLHDLKTELKEAAAVANSKEASRQGQLARGGAVTTQARHVLSSAARSLESNRSNATRSTLYEGDTDDNGALPVAETVLASKANIRRQCLKFEQPKKDQIMQRRSSGACFAPRTSSADDFKQEYVFLLVPPYWGSTALLSLLATSPEVSTLCSAGTWACEGTGLLIKRGLLKRGYRNRWRRRFPSDWNRALKVYDEFWDHSKLILMDKSPPNIVKARQILHDLTATGKTVKFVAMGRSPCYASSHPFEADYAQALLDLKEALPRELVHFIRYESLLRDPYGEADRLLRFLPQLKRLDPAKYGLEVAFENRSTSLYDFIINHEEPFQNMQTFDARFVNYMKMMGYEY